MIGRIARLFMIANTWPYSEQRAGTVCQQGLLLLSSILFDRAFLHSLEKLGNCNRI
jgi:hypothetical protein